MSSPTSVTNAGEWCTGQSILSEFAVERMLGEGGMGKVYLLKSQITGMRFAVKRAKGLSDADRRNFLAELKTWIDLPDHPNLVPCRFFRTLGDEVLIFADFVEGGSLKDWIDSGKLYEGGRESGVKRILDVAIQFAWGLHCVHELGLVHQDVKPGNVMMDTDTEVAGFRTMVSDFGLARARAAGGERYLPDLCQSLLVSSGGYTPAYCSPEQSAGRKLDRCTDVWSWGVSVLEMFQGGVTWHTGTAAREALDIFLEHNGEEVGSPAMPVELAEVLKYCFENDPAQRWQKLSTVVDYLRKVYPLVVGTEYSRKLCDAERSSTAIEGVEEGRTFDDESWTNPSKWLERALKEDGRDPGETAEIVERNASSRRGQVVADISMYDEARRIYERLLTAGRKNLEDSLAILCANGARVHVTAGDYSGALALFHRAIEIMERLVNVEGRSELANSLAAIYMNKALALNDMGNHRDAVALNDQAIEIRERLVNVEGRRELANNLADLYQNKALALHDAGDHREAVDFNEQAIEIRERLVNVEGHSELANSLAALYMNKALAHRALGAYQATLKLNDRAIEIMERMVDDEGRSELANNLADLYQNKADTLNELGESSAAVALNDRAIEIRERLVNVEGQSELANDLAHLYQNKAIALMALGKYREAVDFNDRAIEIRERLVNVEGHSELANNLATLYMNKALALNNSGDYVTAIALNDRAIRIMERLVNVEGRRELAKNLANLYQNKALALTSLRDNQEALCLFDQAIEIYIALTDAEGHIELFPDLAGIYQNKGKLLIIMGEYLAAYAIYDRAIIIRERLVNIEGRKEVRLKLANLYIGQALAARGSHDFHAATVLYDRAIKILERLVNVEGRDDLTTELTNLYEKKQAARKLDVN